MLPRKGNIICQYLRQGSSRPKATRSLASVLVCLTNRRNVESRESNVDTEVWFCDALVSHVHLQQTKGQNCLRLFQLIWLGRKDVRTKRSTSPCPGKHFVQETDPVDDVRVVEAHVVDGVSDALLRRLRRTLTLPPATTARSAEFQCSVCVLWWTGKTFV